MLLRSVVIAFALMGMLFSSVFFGAAANGGSLGWDSGILGGSAVFLTSLALYAWAENIRQRPRFLIIPAFWLAFTLTGMGTKGVGLFIGLPILILLSAMVRRSYCRKAPQDAVPVEGSLPAA